MNIIQGLSSNQKNFLIDIVDFYKKAMANFKVDPTTSSTVFGIFLKDSFYNDNYGATPCLVDGDLNLNIKFFNVSNEPLSFTQKTKNDLSTAATIQMQFLERLNFIHRLWENGLIYFVGNLDSKISDFAFSEKDNEYCRKMNISALLWPLGKIEYFDFIERYFMAQVIPSEYLIDFCEHDFTTITERQYKEQLSINTTALKRAKTGNIIAILVAILTMTVTIICSIVIPISVNEKQHQEIIETIENIHNGQTTNEKP